MGIKAMTERWTSVAHVQPVRAKVPRRVVACALGWACWKTYLGAAGDRHGSGNVRWACLGTVYTMENTARTRCRARGRVDLCGGALAHQKQTFSSRRPILRSRIKRLDGLKRLYS